MKGYKLITIGGKERPLKFGTNQTAKYCEVRSISLQDYWPGLIKMSLKQTDKKYDDYKDCHDINIIDLVYSDLWAGAKTEKIDIEFNEFDIGDWMDEIAVEDMTSVFDTLSESNDDGIKDKEVSKKK